MDLTTFDVTDQPAIAPGSLAGADRARECRADAGGRGAGTNGYES